MQIRVIIRRKTPVTAYKNFISTTISSFRKTSFSIPIQQPEPTVCNKKHIVNH